jgi:hypothetical protein
VATNGHFETLKRLAGYHIYPDQQCVNKTAANGHLEVLEWLAQIRKLYPDQQGVNKAAVNGHLGVLKWLFETKKLHPDQQGINDTAVNVLKWLAQRAKSNQSCLCDDATYNQLEVLRWSARTIGLCPNQADVQLERLRLLIQHSFRPK